jgi:hypothetical protein
MTKADEPPPVVSDVTWEAPPAGKRTKYDWTMIAKHLRSRPGEWAKVFDDDRTSLVNAIRQGAVKPLAPDLGFEVRTRNNVRAPIRKCSLYMRYVPREEKG